MIQNSGRSVVPDVRDDLAAVSDSGLVLAFAELDAIRELWDTDYGRILGAKLLLFAFALAIAAWHRFVSHPRLATGVHSEHECRR